MRAVIQRVSRAQVETDGAVIGSIERGMLVLLGVSKPDDGTAAELLAKKIATLRIFEDNKGKLNKSVDEVNGGVLVISNFTLYADCRKGRRPDFTSAAPYEKARELYHAFVGALNNAGVRNIQTGRFGADMKISMTGDGPVTIIIESEELR